MRLYAAPQQGAVEDLSLGKFLPLLLTFYTLGFLRARPALRQIERMHKQYASEPHYYLDNLAVLPGAQGKGFASELLRPILATAEEQKVMVYTDTVTRSNVGLYEHFGFQCVEECRVAGTGLTVWALRRPIRFARTIK